MTLELSEAYPDHVFASDCPSRIVLDHVTSKWGVLVLVGLAEESPLRWGELRRRGQRRCRIGAECRQSSGHPMMQQLDPIGP